MDATYLHHAHECWANQWLVPEYASNWVLCSWLALFWAAEAGEI